MSLILDPVDALTFLLVKGDNTPRSVMTLTNNSLNEFIAFKVKTTQPRRYLVRPNQGLVSPGSSEEVTIILVDKDKQTLLNEYEQLGPEALESSKDKFLIISCVVDEEYFNATKSKNTKEMAESLTAMWSKVASEKETTTITNKKLHVKHTVDVASLTNASTTSNASSAGFGQVALSADRIREGLASSASSPTSNTDTSPEQVFSEVASLRKKYDELVAFSVNLTAERDILNNALEQAKRDLNREMAARMSAEDSAVRTPLGNSTSGGSSRTKLSEDLDKKGGFTFLQLLIAAMIMFFVGRFAGGKGGGLGSLGL